MKKKKTCLLFPVLTAGVTWEQRLPCMWQEACRQTALPLLSALRSLICLSEIPFPPWFFSWLALNLPFLLSPSPSFLPWSCACRFLPAVMKLNLLFRKTILTVSWGTECLTLCEKYTSNSNYSSVILARLCSASCHAQPSVACLPTLAVCYNMKVLEFRALVRILMRGLVPNQALLLFSSCLPVLLFITGKRSREMFMSVIMIMQTHNVQGMRKHIQVHNGISSRNRP